LCYHLRPTLRLARGGWCIRHQDARMVPHKLVVYHDAKLATNHKTDIHIDYMCVYLYISNYIEYLFISLYIFLHMCINYLCIYMLYIYMCVWYAMGCPTIFIQSHYDCRDLGEDASTNEALSGWIWRNPWRCVCELRCWTPSGDGRCRWGRSCLDFPRPIHVFDVFGYRQLRQD